MKERASRKCSIFLNSSSAERHGEGWGTMRQGVSYYHQKDPKGTSLVMFLFTQVTPTSNFFLFFGGVCDQATPTSKNFSWCCSIRVSFSSNLPAIFFWCVTLPSRAPVWMSHGEAGGKTHTAFVFVKPHAVYEKAERGAHGNRLVVFVRFS